MDGSWHSRVAWWGRARAARPAGGDLPEHVLAALSRKSQDAYRVGRRHGAAQPFRMTLGYPWLYPPRGPTCLLPLGLVLAQPTPASLWFLSLSCSPDPAFQGRGGLEAGRTVGTSQGRGPGPFSRGQVRCSS